MTHRISIRLTGLIWLLMGAWLMYKGVKFITYGLFAANNVASFFGCPKRGAAFLISAGLLIGYLKGKFVLSERALRVAARIRSLPLPLSLGKIYAPSYWILIGSMMALGMLLNILPAPLDLRGMIDLAIGAALVRGSFIYFIYDMAIP